ncbi:PAS domain S-box-containing protein [Methanolinea mesophila]|uniref:sensor histidine kinase n=1 Tax=Methanolinea mesophila TaxID=547055 RepID=UPI001AEB82E2|nr:ATP-binding protein [Methanolinea mesophila]MBP1928902.1 PAS domain S-box-containing protein [Methanolinea mesophila]
MVAVIGLIGISYLTTEQTLRENARTLELHTEDHLAAVFITKEEGLRVFDESLNKRMEESFPLFVAEYERSGRDPSKMDLEAVKSALGGDMELIVIDEHSTIRYTTYPRELGLNFEEFAPYFAEYLQKIRLSEGVFPDRIVNEKSTGTWKKYAYMPTPDHRYILEFGLAVDYPSISTFRFLDRELIDQVEQDNPYVENVRVFDSTLRERVNDTSVDITDPAFKEFLAGVLANRTTVEVQSATPGETTRYLFIDLRDPRYGSDVSRIVELTYNDLPIREALASSVSFYLSLGAIAFIFCGLGAFVVIRTFTRPIGRMADDVDSIAAGDLDHPLSPPLGQELLKLEESVTAMVSRLKTMIAELRESEEKYRTLVQSANSIILRFDTAANITFMNSYALKFFGYSEDEILGKNLVGTIVPSIDSSGNDLGTKIHDLFVHPEQYEASENENIKKDGSVVWISWTNQPLRDQEGAIIGILSIGNDITRLKQAEREIQTLNSELEQRVADRTRQLTEVNRNLESFTYSVSHDLRSPLRAISGYSSILLEDLANIPEKERRYLEMLRQNAHEMGRLIDDLLNFSRLGQRSLQITTIHPQPFIREILQDLREDPAASRVQFIIGDLPPCRADPVLMKQVLTNLLSNAIKFSRMREHPVVEIGATEKDGCKVFFVRDNGVGFDMRYAGKIFGVFQRLHNADEYEGTGVGLAIVHRIIELHGGVIWVESAPDQGTTFYFTCASESSVDS